MPRWRKCRLGSVLHDIGKVAHTGKYLEQERPAQSRRVGNMSLTFVWSEDSRSAYAARADPEMVLHHHEYFDGSGYPDALKRRQQSTPGARIIAVSRCFDTSPRPEYRKARTAGGSAR